MVAHVGFRASRSFVACILKILAGSPPVDSELLKGSFELLMGSCELLMGSCELLMGSCELLMGSCELLSSRTPINPVPRAAPKYFPVQRGGRGRVGFIEMKTEEAWVLSEDAQP
jgi:hypothetical protein